MLVAALKTRLMRHIFENSAEKTNVKPMLTSQGTDKQAALHPLGPTNPSSIPKGNIAEAKMITPANMK